MGIVSKKTRTKNILVNYIDKANFKVESYEHVCKMQVD